jgi:hypothetical protein
MNDWPSVAEKLSLIISCKIHEIRRDVPTDLLVAAALDVLASANFKGPATPIDVPGRGVVNLPVDGFAAAIGKINEMHESKIMEEMSSLGVDTIDADSEVPSGEDKFVREVGSRLLVRAGGMTFSVDKEFALKAVSLGVLP